MEISKERTGKNSMGTILIISDEQLVTDSIAGDKILLATKVPYLFEDLSDPRVDVIALENEKPMPAVETWALLDKINNILKKVIGAERSWVYEAGYCFDGASLTQDCLGILGIMEIIEQIFANTVLDKIILYPTADNMIECMLTEEIARNNGIKLTKHYGNICNFLYRQNFGFIAYLKYIRFLLRTRIKFAVLQKKAQKNTDKEEKEYQLGMFHASNSQKSISQDSVWVYVLQAEFETYRMTCCNASQAAAHFRNKGIAVDNMEDWLTKETLQRREREYRRLLKPCLQAICSEFEFFYHDLNISKTVRHFIFVHFFAHVPMFLELDSICYDYFKKNRFKVINSYGDSSSMLTRAIYYATRDTKTVLYIKKNLDIFDELTYEPYPDMIGVRFFYKDSTEYNRLIEQGWKGQAYFIGDTGYILKLEERFKNMEEIAAIPKKISVLWVPSYVLRGYTTFNTFRGNNMKILQHFKENGWKLYVKFHPNQLDEQVKELYEQYLNCENIQFVDKNESIYDWIEKADIIISDKSLSIFDSVVKGKPVMVLCSPLHYSIMKVHERGINIYQNIEDMFSELSNIENDWHYYQLWREKTVARQDDYFRSYIQEEGNPIKEMADILKRECGL